MLHVSLEEYQIQLMTLKYVSHYKVWMIVEYTCRKHWVDNWNNFKLTSSSLCKTEVHSIKGRGQSNRATLAPSIQLDHTRVELL